MTKKGNNFLRITLTDVEVATSSYDPIEEFTKNEEILNSVARPKGCGVLINSNTYDNYLVLSNE